MYCRTGVEHQTLGVLEDVREMLDCAVGDGHHVGQSEHHELVAQKLLLGCRLGDHRVNRLLLVGQRQTEDILRVDIGSLFGTRGVQDGCIGLDVR